jgi:hypothetical protein
VRADRRRQAQVLRDRSLEVAGSVGVLIDRYRPLEIAAEDLGLGRPYDQIRVAAPGSQALGLART